jgi:transposase
VDAAGKEFKEDDKRELIALFQDEARFGRISDLYSCWCPEKTRPILPMQLIREYTYAYTSVNPKTGQTFSLILPEVNLPSMKLYLSFLSEEYKNNKIVLVMDNAGWHSKELLEGIDNIKIIFQPPCTPEVNPVEHIWEHIRENYLSNQIWDSLMELEEKLCEVLKTVYTDLAVIKSLTNFNWLNW